MAPRVADRVRYRQRIHELVSNPPTSTNGIGSELEIHAHWAKYTCVLISGYIEQSIKEILLDHTSTTAAPRIRQYVEKTWPVSKNMRSDAISEVLGHFDQTWAEHFDVWIKENERKKEINEIIKWRNDIAHGKESNTNNVTLASVKTKFQVAHQLVELLETLSGNTSAPQT